MQPRFWLVLWAALTLGLGNAAADQPLAFPKQGRPWWQLTVPDRWTVHPIDADRLEIRAPDSLITVNLWSRQHANDDQALNEFVAETEVILGNELAPEMVVQPDGFRPLRLNSLRGVKFWARGVGKTDQQTRDMDFSILRVGPQRWLFMQVTAKSPGGERHQPQLQQLVDSLRGQ